MAKYSFEGYLTMSMPFWWFQGPFELVQLSRCLLRHTRIWYVMYPITQYVHGVNILDSEGLMQWLQLQGQF